MRQNKLTKKAEVIQKLIFFTTEISLLIFFTSENITFLNMHYISSIFSCISLISVAKAFPIMENTTK